MPALTIRNAILSDATQIAEIHLRSWQSAYAGIFPTPYLASLDRMKRVRMWQSILMDDERRRHVLVAESQKAVVGFVNHGPAREAEFQDWREIYSLYIDPDAQAQGFGRLLLLACLNQIETRGDMGAYLWVIAANPARYFYEAMGGVLLAERDDEVAGQSHRLLGYAWPTVAEEEVPPPKSTHVKANSPKTNSLKNKKDSDS